LKGKLFIISTPIGNLNDITLRAIETLKNVDYIACEDTRITNKLLNKYKIKGKLISYHSGNEEKRRKEIVEILKSGKKVGLVSDAGTPCISDPGELIVKEVIENGIDIEVIPGPSSIITSLVISGLKTTPFIFLGFLPRKKGEIENLIDKYFFIKGTLIFYESPHRILETLKILKEKFPKRNVVIVKELTKIYEKIYRGKIKDIYYEIEKNEIKGEYTILIENEERMEWEKDFEILKTLNFNNEEILKFMTQKYKGIKNIIKKRLFKDIEDKIWKNKKCNICTWYIFRIFI